MDCIYCPNRTQPRLGNTLEHIFPDALGGDYLPDDFKTRDVCATCNSLCGLFVDGPFIRNFFVQNSRVTSALRFADLKNPRPMPMRYLGGLKELTIGEDQVCEVWFGALGAVRTVNAIQGYRTSFDAIEATVEPDELLSRGLALLDKLAVEAGININQEPLS